ncbi:2'-5' RNA ligase family protein [Nocardioides aestuarii]|uniref:2'-5' RNA ligase family protein n=1 Tax=Nocardioides aestuarii TaxID=252231 RepID=A0ABW4TNM7_9ACTN
MVQAVELTLDRTSDDRVRAEWAALRDAGLPSLADHTGETNAPHVTLHVRDAMEAAAEERLLPLPDRLPLELWVGSVVLFHSRRRWVVARQVVVDRTLLEFHEAVGAAVGGGGSPLTVPGRWVPHLSIARGVRDDQLPQVLALLATTPPYAATALRLRRWDQDRRQAWVVDQASTGRSL